MVVPKYFSSQVNNKLKRVRFIDGQKLKYPRRIYFKQALPQCKSSYAIQAKTFINHFLYERAPEIALA